MTSQATPAAEPTFTTEETRPMTAAQHRALTACVAEIDATIERAEKARAAGAPIVVPSRTDIPVRCDMRSAGLLVEAGLARWVPSMDGHVRITPAGFDAA